MYNSAYMHIIHISLVCVVDIRFFNITAFLDRKLDTYYHLTGFHQEVDMSSSHSHKVAHGSSSINEKTQLLRVEQLGKENSELRTALSTSREEKFQSIMTVPIIGKGRNLIGVITMHTVAPYEFTEQHQAFVSNTATLVASAIENAQLYENTQRKLSILTSLSVLSQTISSGLYLDDMLHSLAALAVQIMEGDLCVIMLMDQARDRDIDVARHPRRLTVRATSPNLNDRAHFQPIDVDRQ